MNGPYSPCSGFQRGWTTEARTPMGWKEYTSEYYVEINPTKINQNCLTSKAYKGLAPADLRISYDVKIL